MLDRLFPGQLNNTYRGHPLAKWAFVLMTVVTLVRSLIHMFASDGGAQHIATIPLDTFTVNGANAVILAFALWGLSQLLIGLIYVIVLWRYQALIPAMRIVLGAMKPIETVETAPGATGNFIIVPLALVMLFLSLSNKDG